MLSSYKVASYWIVFSVDTQKLAEMETMPEAFTHQTTSIVFRSHVGWLIPKFILIGNDIDIKCIDQVIRAMATRSHPERDCFTYLSLTTIPLVPYLEPEEKAPWMSVKAL